MIDNTGFLYTYVVDDFHYRYFNLDIYFKWVVID